MPHRFTPLSMERLVAWISDELMAQDAILGIPRELFFRPQPRGPLELSWRGARLDTPIGVAAGPHSQLAANIVAAWLCGARMIELKTVQALDEITVTKPCIDMEDAGYNIEWSQELTLDQSFDEYLHAWVLVHALHHRLGLPGEAPGVVFDVSVGYDLKGVRQTNMQRFLERCLDAGRDLDRAAAAVAARIPEATAVEIPRRLASGITLSTMHGCRPEEIGLIAGYLMERWRLPTTVKLNPTLLGAEEVAHILHDELGFQDITLSKDAFDGDPTLAEAVELIRELTTVAERRGVSFGIKLANTLPVVNHRDVFTLEQARMYLSGRPLHAVAVRLASRLQEELEGRLTISFAGGADAFNTPALLAAGLAPITTCSDLLRPGGYLRLRQYLDNITAALDMVGADRLDGLILRTDRRLGPVRPKSTRTPRAGQPAESLELLGRGASGPRAQGRTLRALPRQGQAAARALRLHRRALHRGLRRRPARPRVHATPGERRPCRRGRGHRRGQPAAVHTWPRLPPPMRAAVPAHPPRRSARDPRD